MNDPNLVTAVQEVAKQLDTVTTLLYLILFVTATTLVLWGLSGLFSGVKHE